YRLKSNTKVWWNFQFRVTTKTFDLPCEPQRGDIVSVDTRFTDLSSPSKPRHARILIMQLFHPCRWKHIGWKRPLQMMRIETSLKGQQPICRLMHDNMVRRDKLPNL